MIVAFVGSPGSGKSYEAVKKIVQNLAVGRCVYTNIEGMDEKQPQEMIKALIDMDDKRFHELFHFLTQEQTMRFFMSERTEIDPETGIKTAIPNCKHGSLIVLDEVHKNFSNRDWNTEANKKFANWASTHRHYGYDVVLITQDIEKVEKHARSLIEWTYFYRKVNFFGGAIQKKYLCYAYSGDDHNGKPLAKNVRTYDSKIFRCYKSYATKDAKEVGFMTHVNILKHPVFFIIPVVLLFAVYMIFVKSSIGSGDLFGTAAIKKKQDAVIADLRKKDAAQQNTVKTAAVPAAPALAGQLGQSPVQGQMSSGHVYTVPSISQINTQMSEYQQYPIQGFVDLDGKKAALINGRIVKLPHKYVQNIDRVSMVCEGKSSFFGNINHKN